MIMKVAFGITFKSTKYISALLLCLNSIKRFSNFKYEIFIQVHLPDDKTVFDEKSISQTEDNINFHYYKGSPLLYKQSLIDWVLRIKNQKKLDYLVTLHSDVFLYNKTAVKNLLTPFKNEKYAISYYDVPLTWYESTFHIDERAKKSLLIPPRCSEWFMAINLNKYDRFIKTNKLIYAPFIKDKFYFIDPEKTEYHEWVKKQPGFKNLKKWKPFYLMDIGTFLKYYLDKKLFKGFSLGVLSNPNFNRIEFDYNGYGFVHIEQFDPDRFNNTIYKEDLLVERDKMVSDILSREYNIQLKDKSSF